MPELKTLGLVVSQIVAPYEDAQALVASRSVTVPPLSAVVGTRYIVPSAATGAWLGHVNQIAVRDVTPAWTFINVVEGMTAWVHDESAELIFNGTSWFQPSGSGGSGGTVGLLNKRMPARHTNVDGDRACDIAIAIAPVPGTSVRVLINGLEIPEVGDGTKVAAACFWSGDGGFTPRALNAIKAGDVLYWVQSIAGYGLANTDVIDFVYEVT